MPDFADDSAFFTKDAWAELRRCARVLPAHAMYCVLRPQRGLGVVPRKGNIGRQIPAATFEVARKLKPPGYGIVAGEIGRQAGFRGLREPLFC